MKQTKFCVIILLELLFLPSISLAQNFLKALAKESVVPAVRGAVAPAVERAALESVVSGAANATTQVAVEALAGKGIDPAWLRSWQAGKVPAVTVHYTPDVAEIQPMATLPQTEIVIDGRVYVPFTQGVSEKYDYGEERGIDTTWFSTPLYEQLDNVARRENLSYKSSVLRALARSRRLYASLRSKIVEEEIPFTQILPAEKLDRLYVLLQHGQTFEDEVLNLVRAAKHNYPTRQIIVATEYVWDNSTHVVATQGKDGETHLKIVGREEEQPGDLRMARTQEELEMISDDDYENYPFLQKVIDEGIPVVGIEPGAALIGTIVEEVSKVTNLPKEFLCSLEIMGMMECSYQNLATSGVGMRLRNERWEENLVRIEEQFPEALVVVVGGAAHLSYTEKYSVPNLTKTGAKSFSIMLMGPQGKDLVSPFLSGLEDRTYDQIVHRISPSPRYILSIKKPSADGTHRAQDVQNARRVIGADVVVILP